MNKGDYTSVARVQFTSGTKNAKLIDMVQAVTGALSTDRKDLVQDVSHLVQRGIQGRLATGLAEEYATLKARGGVEEDYETTDQFRQEMSYVFDAIRSDKAIDEKRFRAMKNIFLNSAHEKITTRDDMLPVELMRECGTLNGGEILVLETAYYFNQEARANPNIQLRYIPNAKSSWLELIAKESRIGVPDMVARYEATLMQKGLLSERTGGNQIIADTRYHLSGMGIRLCEFIKEYEP